MRKPWEIPGMPWTTSGAWWSYMKGKFRKIWSDYPVKTLFIQNHKVKIDNPNPRSVERFPQVWGMQCAQCKRYVTMKQVRIDHIIPAGSFTSEEHVLSYFKGLFMLDWSNLQSMCVPCHDIKTHADLKGVSFEEASLDKEVIAVMDLLKGPLTAWLAKHGEEYLKPKEKNRAVVRKILANK